MNYSFECMDSQKKRGRKPKNQFIPPPPPNSEIPQQPQFVEKKKRGRKKKYEIENFNKIVNRDLINNFNHNIAYSDDEETATQVLTESENGNGNIIEKQVKKVSFGNLDITVSKTIKEDPNYRNNLINEVNKSKSLIDENEYSDEESEIPVESIMDLNQENFEKYYKDNKKYITNNSELINKDKSVKRLRVITTLKNVIKDSTFPTKTNVCCWWCCHKFDTTPCTLPIKYDSYTKKYTVTGLFCSWNCTKSYNIHKNDHKVFERAQLITLIVKHMYGICNAVNIKSAPYRECLKMFGGYLTIDEFRDDFSVVDSYHLNLVKFNYVYPEITEITNLNVKNNKKNLRLSRTN